MVDDQIRGLIRELGTVAEGIGGLQEVEVHEHDVATQFDRCRSMFAAIVLLLDNRFIQEAGALCRPLFEDSLALAEVAAADERRRVQLLVGRRLAAYADIEGIFREMKARGDKSVDEHIAFVVRQRRVFERYARQRGAGTKRWQPEDQVKQLADRHGRGNEYTGYRLTHHFVHGSPAITEDRAFVDGQGVAHIGGRNPNLEIWEAGTAAFAAYSFATACRAACKILHHPEPDGLDDLIKRLRALAEPTSTT